MLTGVFVGSTWTFRNAFERHGIFGGGRPVLCASASAARRQHLRWQNVHPHEILHSLVFELTPGFPR